MTERFPTLKTLILLGLLGLAATLAAADSKQPASRRIFRRHSRSRRW
jgi:hypothetical protein